MGRTSFFFVMLNLFQHPFLVTSGGFWGAMDPEPKASAAKQVQDDLEEITQSQMQFPSLQGEGFKNRLKAPS
ncbi:hypothetical protein D0Z70_04040 [Sphingobium terrigena]|uniref:Uncharacterized protein n=1 Tax=Sphingobium terrigena TaxID=2304063 RepID=A0A418YVV9_9SPHN|nr:hypothetical protein [Sphingobium terrigena]RJG56536.1 hypothetical protein D0Z70_04040 [Sphingobium terrigena]